MKTRHWIAIISVCTVTVSLLYVWLREPSETLVTPVYEKEWRLICDLARQADQDYESIEVRKTKFSGALGEHRWPDPMYEVFNEVTRAAEDQKYATFQKFAKKMGLSHWDCCYTSVSCKI